MVFEIQYTTPSHSRKTIICFFPDFQKALDFAETFGKNFCRITYRPDRQNLSESREKI